MKLRSPSLSRCTKARVVRTFSSTTTPLTSTPFSLRQSFRVRPKLSSPTLPMNPAGTPSLASCTATFPGAPPGLGQRAFSTPGALTGVKSIRSSPVVMISGILSLSFQ